MCCQLLFMNIKGGGGPGILIFFRTFLEVPNFTRYGYVLEYAPPHASFWGGRFPNSSREFPRGTARVIRLVPFCTSTARSEVCDIGDWD